VSALSAVYGGVARLRRSWYERRPSSRVRLSRPVISIGNLVAGGSGKTPVVAAVAEVLAGMGHRPAILSRGYARTDRSADVVVVSDGSGPLVTVEQSGDEPQMLARESSGVPVVVAADRATAGRTAIDRFDSTVLILDDGFQHLQLERTVDLLVMSSVDLGEKLLPSGRLREPLSAARAAHAVLVYGTSSEAEHIARQVGVEHSFFVTAGSLPLGWLHHTPGSDQKRVAAVAAIARPKRFYDALRRHGYEVVSEFTFPDHHWFTDAEVKEIEIGARRRGASAIVTTAKDAVRLERHHGVLTLPWAILPLKVSIEPGAEFESWLRQRL
jgi:tetraacyldisaccharide 4'-kinase